MNHPENQNSASTTSQRFSYLNLDIPESKKLFYIMHDFETLLNIFCCCIGAFLLFCLFLLAQNRSHITLFRLQAWRTVAARFLSCGGKSGHRRAGGPVEKPDAMDHIPW